MINFNFGGNKKEESVGLDIGSYSVKVVSMGKEGGKNVLSAYNIKRIPTDQKSVRIENVIKETFEEIDLHPESINLSISGPDVIVRFINLPKMTKQQLEGALSFEAEKYIPFDINEVVLDSIVLGAGAEAGQMQVLLAAAKRELIESVVHIAEKLDMSVNLLDISPFAVFNAFSVANQPAEDSGTAFLHIGHSQTDVLVSIGGVPSFMRQIQIGGKDVTAAICKGMSISAEEAEERKLGLGEVDTDAVLALTTSVLEDLIKEVQLSMGYFENRYNKNVSEVFCSGGMIYQPGVIEFLVEKLGIEVKQWNPVKGIDVTDTISKEDVDSVAAQLAVSIGLAIRD
ncbi:MAG: type IV pilus assembly protein PilM [Candidatus Tantalella remota]|nr:type IV pilus assembly protein PilM [Candidatus Tantalella remota]